jgi:S-adenosylmethionine/arginine decarboxylase-like enzyme
VTKILEHKHLIVRAEVQNPPKDPVRMEQWMSDMVTALNMRAEFPPRAFYSNMEGNRGLTCDVILNTSNAVIHTWDEVDPGLFMLDVYTCGSLDPKVIFNLLQEFCPIKIEYKYLDREHGLTIIEEGVI